MSDFITANGTFFDTIWTESLDEHFLRELESHALQAGRSLTFDDDEIFGKILSDMHWYTDHVFPIEAIHRRFKLENLRYQTWKGIKEHEGVVYDHVTMSVTASNWTWIELFETYDLANAYYKVGVERMWNELNAIFGPDDARNPEIRSKLPPKHPRAFNRVLPSGRVLPTIDELLADIMEEEKRVSDENERKEKKKKGIINVTDPADCMSSTKGPGVELIPAREVIVISPEMSRERGSCSSGSRAKRFLSF